MRNLFKFAEIAGYLSIIIAVVCLFLSLGLIPYEDNAAYIHFTITLIEEALLPILFALFIANSARNSVLRPALIIALVASIIMFLSVMTHQTANLILTKKGHDHDFLFNTFLPLCSVTSKVNTGSFILMSSGLLWMAKYMRKASAIQIFTILVAIVPLVFNINGYFIGEIMADIDSENNWKIYNAISILLNTICFAGFYLSLSQMNTNKQE